MLTPYKLLQNKEKARKNILYEKKPEQEYFPKNRHFYRSTSVTYEGERGKSLNESDLKISRALSPQKYEIVMRQTIRRVSTYRMNHHKHKEKPENKNQFLRIQAINKNDREERFDGFFTSSFEQKDFSGLEGKKCDINKKSQLGHHRSLKSPAKSIHSSTSHRSENINQKLKVIGNISERMHRKQGSVPKKILINTPKAVVSYQKLQHDEQEFSPKDHNVANFIRGKKKKQKVINSLKQTEKDINITDSKIFSELTALIEESKEGFLQYSQIEQNFKGNYRRDNEVKNTSKLIKTLSNRVSPTKKTSSLQINDEAKKDKSIAGWETNPLQPEINDNLYILFSP